MPIPKASARRRNRVILTGDVPSPINPPPGCHFHARCPYAMPRCRVDVPALREVKPGHWASCHLHDGGVTVSAEDCLCRQQARHSRCVASMIFVGRVSSTASSSVIMKLIRRGHWSWSRRPS